MGTAFIARNVRVMEYTIIIKFNASLVDLAVTMIQFVIVSY